MLAAPIDKEPLLLYVAANVRAVSVAIVVERKEAGKEHPVQQPVYYIIEVLIESNNDIRIGRSSFMGCSWQDGSLSNISKVIPSLWLALLLWGI